MSLRLASYLFKWKGKKTNSIFTLTIILISVWTSVFVAFSVFSILFPCTTDSFTNLGLLVLWGIQNPVPRRTDTDPPQWGADPTGSVAAGHLPDFQANHCRTICWQLPYVHAGKILMRSDTSPLLFWGKQLTNWSVLCLPANLHWTGKSPCCNPD